jgi:hypothetical protein
MIFASAKIFAYQGIEEDTIGSRAMDGVHEAKERSSVFYTCRI